MKELIDKAEVVAEIEKLQKVYSKLPTRNNYEDGLKEGRLIGYKDALNKINTLEVKDMNLEEEFDKYCENLYVIDIQEAPFTEMYDCAKYFYELGLKAKGE